MSYRQFETPNLAELSEVDRVSPLEGCGDFGVLALRAVADDGDLVELTLDPLGRSIRLVWISDGRRLVDVYREGATRFDVSQEPGSAVLRVAVEYDDAAGLLEVGIGYEVSVKDRLMFN
ncbi:hypothetical protein [Rhodococcus oryzae]|jgi:hypothetical protein|uniref:hypothetical protein n=1 Tax=Rhodococcus oryzae TaxID=2571143 RepID=UPI0037BD0124